MIINYINKTNNFLTKYEKMLEILNRFKTKSNFFEHNLSSTFKRY